MKLKWISGSQTVNVEQVNQSIHFLLNYEKLTILSWNRDLIDCKTKNYNGYFALNSQSASSNKTEAFFLFSERNEISLY